MSWQSDGWLEGVRWLPSPNFGERPAGEAKWNGPYLQKDVPADPWGKPYVFRAPGTRGDFDLISYGRDGAPGGSGENADIGY